MLKGWGNESVGLNECGREAGDPVVPCGVGVGEVEYEPIRSKRGVTSVFAGGGGGW